MKRTRKHKIADYAQCHTCSVDFDLFNFYSRDMQRMRNHIKNTGHTVVREAGSSTYYS